MGLAHRSLVSPCRSFSFLFLFRLIPWSTGSLCVHFPAWASKTHSRRCLRWGTFRDSRGRLQPTWTEQVPCWGFIGFLRKPRNISLFSLLYFLNCKILSLSLSLFLSVANAVLLRESLDPTSAGPWYFSIFPIGRIGEMGTLRQLVQKNVFTKHYALNIWGSSCHTHKGLAVSLERRAENPWPFLPTSYSLATVLVPLHFCPAFWGS